MKKLLLPISIFIMMSGCVTNTNNLNDEVKSEEEESEKICRTERVLGTRIPETFCYTKEELERMEEDSKEKFEREQRLRERQRVQETLGTLRPD
tara:strand:- start:71 stop:352 length:282 start_codon:yes stop_codon:yes gene_type:complete